MEEDLNLKEDDLLTEVMLNYERYKNIIESLKFGCYFF